MPVTEIQPIKIPRIAGHIRIMLPIGGEGDYQVEFLGSSSGADPLLRTSATASIENQMPVLDLRFNLGNLKTGNYLIALKHDDSAWERYPVVLQ